MGMLPAAGPGGNVGFAAFPLEGDRSKRHVKNSGAGLVDVHSVSAAEIYGRTRGRVDEEQTWWGGHRGGDIAAGERQPVFIATRGREAHSCVWFHLHRSD